MSESSSLIVSTLTLLVAVLEFILVMIALIGLVCLACVAFPFPQGRRFVMKGFSKLCDWVIFNPETD